MATARDLITRSLKKIGIVGTGQVADAEEINNGLDELNGMIGQWQYMRWLVYRLVDSSVVGTGAQTYTIGPAGDIALSKRPDQIEWAYVVQVSPASPTPVSFTMQLIHSRQDYSRIQLKDLSTVPTALFYDPVFPLGVLYPWPIPDSAWRVHVLTKEILQRFDNLDEDFALPDAYEEAIIYNLCIRLGTTYPGVLDAVPDVRVLAESSLETIRTSNYAIATLGMPGAVIGGGRRFNVYSGLNE